MPLASERRVDLIVSELAVTSPAAKGLPLVELAPGVDLDLVRRATETELIAAENLSATARQRDTSGHGRRPD